MDAGSFPQRKNCHFSPKETISSLISPILR
jgi:hypothetical protein